MSTDICYWKHDIAKDAVFRCYDGTSVGCSRSGVEVGGKSKKK